MTKSKSNVKVKDKKNSINIEIINKVENNAENNNHSKNKNTRPESEAEMDTENNNMQPEYTRGPPPIIVNNIPANEPQSQLLRPNINEERNYAPSVTINNERQYYEEQTKQRIFGSNSSDDGLELPEETEETGEIGEEVVYSAAMDRALVKSILKNEGFKQSSKMTHLGSRRLNDLYNALQFKLTINAKRDTIREHVQIWKAEKPNLFN